MVICRTCTNECDDYKLMHSVGLILGKLTTLAAMINYCTGLECPEDEQHKLPEHMCMSCVQKLAKSYLFKQMVLDADEALRNDILLKDEELEEIMLDDEEMNINVEVENIDDICENTTLTLSETEIVEECEIDENLDEVQVNENDNLKLDTSLEIQIPPAVRDEYDTKLTEEVFIDNDLDLSNIKSFEEQDIYEQFVDDEEECPEYTDVEEVKSVNSQHDDILDQDETIAASDVNEANECPVCHKILKNKKSYNLHIKRHDPCNPKTCEYCGKVYRQIETLQRHLLSHTGEKPMECEVCGRRFRFQSNFIAHMRQHTGERPFKCSYCEKTFGTRKHMKRHELVHSSNDNSYPCDICGKSFSQARYLSNHVLRHAGDKPYQCQLCGKAVAQQGYLKRHMLTHTGEKPFQCDMCEKNFRDAKTLKIHKLHHAGIKPFECPYCEKNFSTSRQLKIHAMIHTGETPHTCEICNKSYRVARSLQRHMLVHTEERNHICEVCGFKFRFESNLIAHRRLHSRGDAKCPYCEKAFRTEKQLDRHIVQRHHSSKCQTSSKNGDLINKPTKLPKSNIPTSKKRKVQKEFVNQKLAKSNLVELY